MKKNSTYFPIMFMFLIGFISCDDTDDVVESCPELFYTITQEGDTNGYNFVADFEEIDEVSYEWFVDGELVESELLSDPENKDDLLFFRFETGVHEVCIRAETPECPAGTEFCREIIAEIDTTESCPNLGYTREGDYLIADFEGIDTLGFYGWMVTGEPLGDETIFEDEGLNFEGDNKFLLTDLQPGTYTICLISESPTCGQAEPFCSVIEIEVESDCPELFFEAEQDGDNLAYYFYPNAFQGIDDVTLEWSVNGDYVGTSSGHNDPFYYQFNAGSFEVCLSVETPECPEGVTFCKVIEIEVESDCPELSYTITREGDTNGYNFVADFPGIEEVSYEWVINGEVVDSESVGDPENKDDFLFYQFETGSFDICIRAETPECPRGTQFCETLEIE